jgi:hypothetical protein
MSRDLGPVYLAYVKTLPPNIAKVITPQDLPEGFLEVWSHDQTLLKRNEYLASQKKGKEDQELTLALTIRDGLLNEVHDVPKQRNRSKRR